MRPRTRARHALALLLVPLGGLTAAGSLATAASAAPLAPGEPQLLEAAASPSFYPVTGFGGYALQGENVTQVSASWAVPTARPSARLGAASTWIGAQGTAGPPFIQVGTVEVTEGGRSLYQMFWSDPAVGFHAQVLGLVAAGAGISASLQRTGSSWAVQITDTTSGVTATRTVPASPGAYDTAEWLQEDPAPGVSATPVDVPYPALSEVTFTNLTVDGASPVLTLENGQALLSNGGGDYVPTSVADDSFSLVPPAGYARSYLLLAGAVDRVANAFDALYVNWPHVPAVEKAQVVSQLATAYERFEQRLAGRTWPASATPAVRWMLRRLDVIHWALARWSAAGTPLTGPTAVRLGRALGTEASTGLRTALGLPPA